MGISSNALIDSIDEIKEFIPHRNPMIMVDTLFSIDDELNSSVSGLTVAEDNIFVKKGILSESGLIEHAAQSAALRIGYIFKKQNKSIPIGFICSLNKIYTYRFASVGTKILTTITVLQEIGSLTLINFKSYDREYLLSEGQMKIILDL